MPLDPRAKDLIEMLAMSGFDALETMPVEAGRALTAGFGAMAGEPPEVVEVRPMSIDAATGGVEARLYRPASDEPLPVLVWLHGGGWVFGSVDIDDVFCRTVANDVGAAVVSVDYRLAPEHPYPAPSDDALAATTWVQRNAAEIGGDPARVAIGGESAGGNLAATTILRLRDAGAPPLCLQVLVCAALDSSMGSASYEEHANGKFLTRSLMAWAWDQYARDHLASPYVSPMHAEDLTGVAPALILTAECDPLRDDGGLYHQRLLEVGVPSERHDYEGMIHGFFGMATQFPQAHEAVATVAKGLSEAFASPASVAS
jgi:acetyl esterase